MSEFETLSREAKLDLVLNTVLIYGNGVIAHQSITEIYRSSMTDVSEITELLKSDGFIIVESLGKGNDWGQLSITPEGRLFASKGGYTGDRIDQYADITEYVKDFHRFSNKAHSIKLWVFWVTAIVMVISVIYLMIKSSK